MHANLAAAIAIGSLIVMSAGHALAGVPTPIPEPSSLALIAGAGAVVAWVRFRKGR
jgi:hypothetical protein